MTALGRISVVIPVHNGASHMGECLASLTTEIPATSIIVVDDASTDATADIARQHGAAVIREPASRGPYAARNLGWRASDAEMIVFTDMRCRARPGWLEALSKALTTSGVGIAGCEVEMVAQDHSVAERWAIKHQPLRGYLDHPFLPYVPTACLAIRRTDLERLQGFQERRSGADADLCWRAQQAGLGTVVWGAIGMWARPRTEQAGVIHQFKRYSTSAWELQKLYGYRGDPPPAPQVLGTAWRVVQAVAAGMSDFPVALLDARRIISYERQFRAERKEHLGRGRSLVSP